MTNDTLGQSRSRVNSYTVAIGASDSSPCLTSPTMPITSFEIVFDSSGSVA
jgi:hypothetical protein